MTKKPNTFAWWGIAIGILAMAAIWILPNTLDPVDRWDEKEVLSIVEGCYERQRKIFFEVEGDRIIQDGETLAKISGVGTGRLFDYLAVNIEIKFNGENQRLVRARKVSSSLRYSNRSGPVRIAFVSEDGSQAVFRKVDCAPDLLRDQASL